MTDTTAAPLPGCPMRVGCSVADGNARGLVHRALTLEGAELVELPSPLQRTHVRHLQRCAALIYDLAPWDDDAVEVVRYARRQHPPLPILLYAPHKPGAAQLVLECGAITGVSAHSQFKNSGELSRLRRETRNLLDRVSEQVLAQLVDLLIPGAPGEMRMFSRRLLMNLHVQQRRDWLTVGRVARQLRFSARTLERISAGARLPHPKEWLDWLVLLYVSFEAGCSGRWLATIARRIGLEPRHIYRLRRRLLPSEARAEAANTAQAFDLVFLAFATACGVPKARATALKRRAAAANFTSACTPAPIHLLSASTVVPTRPSLCSRHNSGG